MKVTLVVALSLLLTLSEGAAKSKSKLLNSLLKRWVEYDEAEDCGNTSDCPTPICVDFAFIQGKCCPVCPNGPNCWLQRSDGGFDKIPINSNVIVRNEDFCSTYCRCPGRSTYEREGKQTTATCVSTCYGDYLMY